MGLTATKHKALEDAGFIDLYNDNKDLWKAFAERAYIFIRGPLQDTGEKIRRDDVIQPLVAAIEVSDVLRAHVQARTQKQKYWPERFAELIIDQLWSDLEGLPQNDEATRMATAYIEDVKTAAANLGYSTAAASKKAYQDAVRTAAAPVAELIRRSGSDDC
jgi:hypothetical protein